MDQTGIFPVLISNPEWQPAIGSALCEPCPKGYFCHVEGNDHKIDACEPGYYCIEGTKTQEPCPPGTYSQSSNLDAEDQCLTCPAGQYCTEGTCVATCPDATPTICVGGCIDTSANLLVIQAEIFIS